MNGSIFIRMQAKINTEVSILGYGDGLLLDGYKKVRYIHIQ